MRSLFFFLLFSISLGAAAQNFYLFVGTYTAKGSKGIYVYRFNAATGEAEWVSNTDSVVHPSYLAVTPDGRQVYSVNATSNPTPGTLSAFSFDPQSGKLAYINRQPSGGDNPCYVSVTRRGQWVVAGNYGGGSLAAFRVKKDGSLQAPAQVIQLQGSGPRKQQEKAHVHAVVFSPDERYLFVPDLGTDKLMVYRFKKGSALPLRPAPTPFVAAKEGGSGPRHFTFHPSGKYAYLVEELSGTVEAYRYRKGKLTFLQRLSTHPAGFSGVISSADIHTSPDGKFLYASNRGDANSLAIFAIDGDGKLTLKGHQPTLGVTPRNFMIDPTGNYLLVAHQSTDNIVIFKRDPVTGLLQEAGRQLKVSSPVCLKMIAE
ncbi:lactonase family protein [Paraflavisolibacter sp. H34]|uniref:lactonase family protein n=1 Tax=Huijunlia imazamoxiresistens TaxID=3127457 RepID=UPI003018A5F1